jgi:hypothetical protein
VVVPETPRHRAVPRPRSGVPTGPGRSAGGVRGRAGKAAVLTTVAAVAAVAFVRLATADAASTYPVVAAADLAYLKQGATACPALTPAKLAGQLYGPRRAGKDVVVLSVGPTAWEKYKPSPDAEPADHRSKILALARQTCDLVGQLRVAKIGGDPWQTAVAATHVGLPAVAQAKGVPAGAKAFVSTVVTAAAWYANQPQFGGPTPQAPLVKVTPATTTTTPATPTTTPAAKPPVKAVPPAPKPKPKAVPTTAAPTTTAPPLVPTAKLPTTPPSGALPAYDPEVEYQIVNPHAKRVLELPGDDTDTRTGTAVQIWTDQGAADQHWYLKAVPGSSGYLHILNASSGKALSVRDGSLEDFAGVDQVVPHDTDLGQQWELRDAGQGEVWILNRLSGKALDLFGDDLPAADGQQVDLWALQTYAVDQRWTIVR